jgi:hypothetical protein
MQIDKQDQLNKVMGEEEEQNKETTQTPKNY